MDKVSEKQALYLSKGRTIKHSEEMHVKLTKKEKRELILSLAGNVEWVGDLARKNTHCTVIGK